MAGNGDEHQDQGEHEHQGDAGGDAGTEENRITTLDAITERLDRLAARVEEFFQAGGHSGKSGDARQPAAPGGSPAPGGTGWQSQAASAEQRRAEIRGELDALKKQEAADKLSQKTQDRIGALEKAFEKPPRELRKIEQFFRWDDAM